MDRRCGRFHGEDASKHSGCMPQDNKASVLTPGLVRDLDRWLGIPLCFLLTRARVLLRMLRGGREHIRGPLNKILFIKMTELGATVLACPAISRAIELVGRENVYFWVFEENRAVLELLDIIPRCNILSVRATRPLHFLADLLKSIAHIRRQRIDASVDLEFFARAPAIFAYLCGARRRAGLHGFTNEGPYRGDLMTHRVAYNAYVHTSVMSAILVESLTADAGDLPLLKRAVPGTACEPPRFIPRDEDITQVRSMLSELGVPKRPPESSARRGGRQDAVRGTLEEGGNSLLEAALPPVIVLLNPNASDMLPLRRWPTERFVELAHNILRHHPDAVVVFTGAPAEAARADELVSMIGSSRAVSLAGRTSMRQLLTLYTLSQVLVTNDSGPAHFAAMTDVYTITMFGPETPKLYAPLNRHGTVVWAGLACSPCVNVLNHRFSPCRNNVCMQVITVEQVCSLVKEALHVRDGAKISPGT